MKEAQTYENFPAPAVLLVFLISISVYVVGAYILAGLTVWLSILYVLYCIWIEIRILKHSCVDCYYYGKLCGLGRGKLCSLVFSKGDPQKFVDKEISWIDLFPDFMVGILPSIGAVLLLVKDFSWLILSLLIFVLSVSFVGNAIIRGSFACKHCKQREIGCPAERLFNKKSQTA
ncbi:MAG: hypothetical protein JSW47_17565 [Phycisphaerales bacterium]|nr:MAG: hypothetical protein JSW47_17565 [Phycisphaerales bacterium]